MAVTASRTWSKDLIGVGQHCGYQGCSQVDFLPFTCDCCHKVFCLEHRTYEAHNCQKAASKEQTTIACPLCAKAIIIRAGQDPNVVFDAHQQTDCDPSNYKKVHSKPKCPVNGCREKLTESNHYICKDCGVKVCLKHRFPTDHACKGKRAGPSTTRPAARPASGGPSSSQPSAAQQLDSLNQSIQQGFQTGMAKVSRFFSSLGTTGMARDLGIGNAPQARAQQRPQQQRAQFAPAARGTTTSTGREICPSCGRSFDNVQQLIHHHESGQCRGSGAPTGARPVRDNVCPQCQAAFSDPVQLVEHFTRCTARQRSTVRS